MDVKKEGRMIDTKPQDMDFVVKRLKEMMNAECETALKEAENCDIRHVLDRVVLIENIKDTFYARLKTPELIEKYKEDMKWFSDKAFDVREQVALIMEHRCIKR